MRLYGQQSSVIGQIWCNEAPAEFKIEAGGPSRDFLPLFLFDCLPRFSPSKYGGRFRRHSNFSGIFSADFCISQSGQKIWAKFLFLPLNRTGGCSQLRTGPHPLGAPGRSFHHLTRGLHLNQISEKDRRCWWLSVQAAPPPANTRRENLQSTGWLRNSAWDGKLIWAACHVEFLLSLQRYLFIRNLTFMKGT